MPRFRFVLVVGIALFAMFRLYLSFSRSGEGAEVASPDGRFRAEAMSLTQRNWRLAEEPYCTFKVADAKDGSTVWHMELRGAGQRALDCHQRDRDAITWSADSASVAFELGGATLSVPLRRAMRP